MATINQDKENYNVLFTTISLIVAIVISQAGSFIIIKNWKDIIIMGLFLTAILWLLIFWINIYLLHILRAIKDPKYDPNIKLNAGDFNLSTSIIMCSYYSANAYSYTNNLTLIALVIIGSFVGTYVLTKLLVRYPFHEIGHGEIDSSISN